ncbi:MAG: threonine ammonia-lyase, biosynthetic [Spirochaetaceae bacterium]|nr:threonine ammonia-lyase, biosynthetic [Myxococcales bacterium]MCB9725823.1 threonine ammonia-lyase, biosynthetic [Spirochaetaceae bacterium]
MSSDDLLERILRAPVYDVAIETPLDEAPLLSARLHNRIRIKREDLQPVFSFKLRGAYNRVRKLSPAERRAGVVAASAGNHAQGIALAAERLGCSAKIVMPRTTPRIKVDAVTRLGGEAILEGDSYDEAAARARAIETAEGRVFVHPYDDLDVIAGQGTIGMEILRQHRGTLDAVFVPVGGGGLIAGIAAYVKRISPGTRVVGVEPEDAACLAAALATGRPVDIGPVGLFADGVAVREVGRHPFEIARTAVDEVVTVGVDEICAAIRDVFDDTRSIAEPAGALSIAGLKRWVAREGVRDANLVAIDSGANMNFDRLRHVAERAEIGEQREALLAVTIPERPGAFLELCRVLGDRAVTEFNYRYGDSAAAHVFVGVALRGGGAQERAKLLADLEREGFEVVDMSGNEMAKLHVRFMVGGRAERADERLFRFEFPERPGALTRFLESVGERWNISLFHYRNHGAAFGRVLAGLEVPAADAEALAHRLAELGYPWVEETENPATALFLG